MLCDLHIHSAHSSGSQSVEQICREAVAKNIRLIALTEDDTTASYGELNAVAPRYGLRYLVGVEVSASLEGRFFRFLAYDYDVADARLQDLLAHNRSVWDDIGTQVLEAYAAHFPEISLDDYRAFEPREGLGGFKHNKYMSSIGRDGSFEGDRRFFAEHPELTQDIRASYRFKDVAEVIPHLHEAGAKVLVSAEYFKDVATFEGMVESVVVLGVDGLECYRGLDPALQGEMVRYATERDLLITGGGNGHGNWADPKKYGLGVAKVELQDLNLGGMRIH